MKSRFSLVSCCCAYIDKEQIQINLSERLEIYGLMVKWVLKSLGMGTAILIQTNNENLVEYVEGEVE